MWLSSSLFFTPIYLSLIRELFLKNSSEVLPAAVDYTGIGYTSQDLIALQKFRNLLSDVIQPNDQFSDDQLLMLWLRKQYFDLDSANQRFREALQWRKDNNIESIMNESILESLPDLCWVDGFAKDGSPIMFARLAGIDARRLVLGGLENNLTRRTYQCLETAMIKSKTMTRSSGKLISQTIAIIDASGFNRFQHACVRCMRVLFRFIRESDEHWPDMLKLVIAVNAPAIAKPILEVVLPLINPRRRKVIKVFGVDKKEWSSYLNEIISPNQLSVKFGGNRLTSP